MFFITGISYKNCNAEIRGRYSLDSSVKLNFLEKAKLNGVNSVMVISTCFVNLRKMSNHKSIAKIDKTIALYPKIGFLELVDITSEAIPKAGNNTIYTSG